MDYPRDCFDECMVRLDVSSFYDLRHQTIWEAMLKIGGHKLDLIMLQQAMKDSGTLEQIGGVQYLNALQDIVTSKANFSYWLDVIVEKHQLRGLIKACTDAVSQVWEFEGTAEELFDKVEHDIAKAGNKSSGRVTNSSESFVELTQDLERRMVQRESGQRSGIETGWHHLDYLTDGFQLGEQIVIGARPSMGKTAIATNLIENICLKNKVPSAFVTCEMRPVALMRRMCASQCRIEMKDLRNGKLSDAEMAKISAFGDMMRKSPIYWVNGVSGINDRQVCSEIRRLVRKRGVQFVVVDYLQKVKPSAKEEKKTYEVGSVSSSLNALSKELNICIVTLAQLNRENEKEKGRRPRLSDLADSKQIEADADMIALLHRERSNDSHIPTDLIIAKQRDGEVGIVNLIFVGGFQRFENAAPQNKVSDEDIPNYENH
jgi:replicative DNA helicase